jgi:hypothetical protein
VDLSRAPSYTALSYVWGPSAPAYEIQVRDRTSDNGKLKVRENLFDFLLEFRAQRGDRTDRYLWIDQLSIDQSTTSERNHQVQMMSDIYSNATSVIVWLGNHGIPKHGDRREAVRNARKLQRREHGDALEIGLQKEYFHRLWIVQEILLAKRIRVLFENQWILDIYPRFRWPEHISDALDSLMDGSHVARPIFRRIGAWKYTLLPEIEHRLDGLLQDFMTHSCEDPRDKIYGLQGLVDPEDRLVVDYTKSRQQLFVDLCNQFHKRVVERYWTTVAHYPKMKDMNKQTRALYKLANWMHFTDSQIRALRRMLRYRLPRLADLSYILSYLWPSTAVGFEPEDEAHTHAERWWFEIRDTRHYFECKESESDLEAADRRRFEAWQEETEESYGIENVQEHYVYD